jgi:antitoxin HicB
MTRSEKYPANVFYSDEDEGYIALAIDLPGCSAFGETQAQALEELQNAIVAWQEAATAAGNPIPPPSRNEVLELPSGKVLLRMPRTLHSQLIAQATAEGVSLNQYVVSSLSGSVSRQASESEFRYIAEQLVGRLKTQVTLSD